MSVIKSLLKRDWFVGLLITGLFLALAETGAFDVLDRGAYNLGVKFSSAREPHEQVVVVAIDDKSLQALGAWPWSRDVIAETTLLLAKNKPSVIGFTTPFDTGQYEAGLESVAELRAVLKKERKLSRRVDRALRQTESVLDGDDKLARVFKSGGRIVLAMPYIHGTAATQSLTASLPEYMQRFTLSRVSSNGSSDLGFGWPKPEVTRAEAVFPPIELRKLRHSSIQPRKTRMKLDKLPD